MDEQNTILEENSFSDESNGDESDSDLSDFIASNASRVMRVTWVGNPCPDYFYILEFRIIY
jgi:hypothetical protein